MTTQGRKGGGVAGHAPITASAEEELRRRIAQAAAIIGRDKCQIVEVQRSARLVQALGTLSVRRALGIRTKRQKIAVDRLARSLRRLEVALMDPHLEPFAQNYFSILEIQQLRMHCEALAKKRLNPPKRRDGELKRRSAAEAALLLERHGLPLNLTRRGKFCRLAGILYGDPQADLFHHCVAVMKDRNRA